MFGIIRSIGKAFTAVNQTFAKFNQTLHGSVEEARRTTAIVKTSTNGAMVAKGVKDCVVSYQCNDVVCLTVSAVGTAADLGGMVSGNIAFLNPLTPFTSSISVGCKFFVHLCQTGNITFISCKDPI